MSMSPARKVNRRGLLVGTAASAAAIGLSGRVQSARAASGPASLANVWKRADLIRTTVTARAVSPTQSPWFGPRKFVVTDYGARPCTLTSVPVYTSATTLGTGQGPAPGSFDNYQAFSAAIAHCYGSRGGQVYVPPGNWYCAGPLLSNVNFHLASGAQIWFSPNPSDYAKYGDYDFGTSGKLVLTRWQGNDCFNFSPMVYAYEQDNIALTGEDHTSILNGQAGTPYSGNT